MIVAQLVLLCLETKLVLVSGAQPVHGTHLVWTQGFAEQVNGRHLSTKHPFFVDIGRSTDVALVERLQVT